MISRKPAALLAVLALLTCCVAPAASAAANNCAAGGRARPDDSGIGGTGVRPGDGEEDDSGVGGTGLQPNRRDDDSGIGGTGISAAADTGVIGTITGFASICVGGAEIHYDAASAVQIDGQPASAADLAVGDVVEVLASGTESDLRAQQIAVRHVVAGPVTRIAADRNELDIMGQTVRLSPSTRGDGDNLATAGEFALGGFVRVSGMRQPDDVIVASRVTRSGDELARLAGAVEIDDAGGITIAGTPVRLAAGSALAAGDELRVDGSWDGERLLASSVERIASIPFGGRVGRVAIEGYASLAPAGQLRVGPYRFDVSRAAGDVLPELAADVRIRVDAVVRDRRAIIERIDAAPELPPRIDPRPGAGLGGNVDTDAPGDQAVHGGHERPPGRDGHDGHGSFPSDRPEGMGAAERLERPERPGGAQPPERPPRIERPASMSRPDLPARPERPERPDRPSRPGGH